MTINYDRALNSRKNHHQLYELCAVDGLWVFGYGSLIWKPDFEYEKAYDACLYGYYRSFCVYSFHHRGTEEKPGLVMGIKKGKKPDCCKGRAYFISPQNARKTLINLRKREQVNEVYYERYLPVELILDEAENIHQVNGQCLSQSQNRKYINALFYEVDKSHKQYASKLKIKEKAAIINKAHGLSGNNRDYVINLYEHLQQSNINDAYIKKLYQALMK